MDSTKSKYRTSDSGDRIIRYWDVYNQAWMEAYVGTVSSRDLATWSEEARELYNDNARKYPLTN